MKYLKPIFEKYPNSKDMITEIEGIQYILQDDGITFDIKKSDTGVDQWDIIDPRQSYDYYVIKLNKNYDLSDPTIEEFIDRCREICSKYDFTFKHATFRKGYTMFELSKRIRKKSSINKKLDRERRQFKGLSNLPVEKEDFSEINEERSSRRKRSKGKIVTSTDAKKDSTHDEKNKWWAKNSKQFSEVCQKLTADDLLIIFNNNKKLVTAVTSSPHKRRMALAVFHALSIEDLDDIVHNNILG